MTEQRSNNSQSTMADANGDHFREKLGKFYCSTVDYQAEAYVKRHGIYSCAECDNFRLNLASKPDSKKPR